MKKYILLLIIIITIITIFICITISKKEKISYQENNKININIKYPKYKYKKVNKTLNKIISSYLKDKSSYHFLTIDYKEYTYNNYISIVLFISYFKGGAHPIYDIKVLNYNTKTNKYITITDITKLSPNLLNKLSIYSKEHFNTLEQFKISTINKMMLKGTEPDKENFSLFNLSNNGLIIYFKRYQIAPYYYGDYQVIIPYNKINLKI